MKATVDCHELKVVIAALDQALARGDAERNPLDVRRRDVPVGPRRISNVRAVQLRRRKQRDKNLVRPVSILEDNVFVGDHGRPIRAR